MGAGDGRKGRSHRGDTGIDLRGSRGRDVAAWRGVTDVTCSGCSHHLTYSHRCTILVVVRKKERPQRRGQRIKIRKARPEGAPPLPKVPSHTRDTRKASLRTSPEDHRIESLSRGNLPHRIGEQRQLKATPKHASRDSPSDY